MARPLLALALLALALLALAGCAIPRAELDDAPLSQRARVAWIDPAPPADRRREILARIDDAERAYQAAHPGPRAEVAILYLWPGELLPRSMDALVPGGGVGLLGMAQVFARGGAWIHLPVGRPSLGAVVHELHHCRLGGDPLHADPSWREVDWLDAQVALGR